ncbi:hypothetical protein FB570_12414 [Streptomyces sp. T12]|nr:hypothetical protein FB570_12414 [Streptomyces sp. T12]
MAPAVRDELGGCGEEAEPKPAGFLEPGGAGQGAHGHQASRSSAISTISSRPCSARCRRGTGQAGRLRGRPISTAKGRARRSRSPRSTCPGWRAGPDDRVESTDTSSRCRPSASTGRGRRRGSSPRCRRRLIGSAVHGRFDTAASSAGPARASWRAPLGQHFCWVAANGCGYPDKGNLSIHHMATAGFECGFSPPVNGDFSGKMVEDVAQGWATSVFCRELLAPRSRLRARSLLSIPCVLGVNVTTGRCSCIGYDGVQNHNHEDVRAIEGIDVA